MNPLYYEAHITISHGNELNFKEYDRLRILARDNGWAITDMYDDSLHDGNDVDVDGTVILTKRCVDNPVIEILPWFEASVREQVNILKNAGFGVVRFKIEATILDTAFNQIEKSVGVALTG